MSLIRLFSNARLSGDALAVAISAVVSGCANPIQSTRDQQSRANSVEETSAHPAQTAGAHRKTEVPPLKKKRRDSPDLDTPLEKDEEMSSDSTVNHGNLQSTKVFFKGEETVVTVPDGVEMREALLSYLRKHSIKHDEFRPDLIFRLEGADVRIDPDSELMRVGHWLLQNRVDQLVLMNRLRTPAPTVAFLAELDRNDDNHWIIADVRLMKIFRSR